MATERGFGVVAAWLLAAVVAGGCKSTSSADLATDGTSADIRVSATSDSATSVRVEMSPGNVVVPFDVVKLDGGDARYAEAAGQRKQLAAGGLDYGTTFATGAADTLFRVILDRKRTDQADATESTGSLPAPFNLRDLGGGRPRTCS